MTTRIFWIPVAGLALLLTACNKEVATAPEKDAVAKPAPPAPPAPPASAPAPNPAAGQQGGLTTTPSGLQYEVLKRGAGGRSPKATDTVTVHYQGTLLDGTVFDSSVQRGQPATFPLNGVIKGWTEGLQLMQVGDKFKFVIPPYLAYGDNSPSPKIPPNSALVFEVELLGIQ